jgi:plastocyanin
MTFPRGWLLAVLATAAVACSSDNSGPTSPTNPGGGGTAGGGGTGTAGAVTVGNDFFQSDHNGTRNPAIDTVAAGTTVTWTWTNTGGTAHSVESIGSPSFTSSAIQAGSGMMHSVMFTTAGTYQYQCAVHGAAMSGRVVVQ